MDALQRENLFRRPGRFLVKNKDGRQYPEFWMAVMGSVCIVRAEGDFLRDGIEYLGFSPLFDELPECCEAPDYEFKQTDNGVEAIKCRN